MNGTMRSSKRRIGFICLCVIPATVLFFIFMILPTFTVFRLSLFKAANKYDPNGTDTFIGLDNFKRLFANPDFIQALQNTIFIIVVVIIITFFFSIVFAAILTREKLKGQNFFRVIFYIPNILSMSVIAGIFSAIYEPERGLLDSFIAFFKGETVMHPWKFQLAIVSLIVAMVWQAIGYYMVMYMSSMSAVSLSLYESAGLDGAGRIKQFFQITLPLIWTNIRTTLTFFIISSINMAFLFIRAFWGTNPPQTTALNYMYTQATRDRGFSMAAGVVIFLFSFLLSALVNKVTKRDVLEV